MKTNMKTKLILLFVPLMLGLQSQVLAQTKEMSIENKMVYRRAIEIINWSQPLVSYKAMRDAFFLAGAGNNDVTYFSKIQNWKWQIATPNSTTPYVTTMWDLAEGPVVIEIPPSTSEVSIFGTLMDSWQRPLEDVGAKGRDGGRGGKYLIVPPNYTGATPKGHIVLESSTNQGWALMRPIIADNSPENIAKAISFLKGIKLHTLGKPSQTKHIDIYDKPFEGITEWNSEFFKDLAAIAQEEVMETRDLAFWGLAASLGIEKGVEYNPSPEREKLLNQAGKEALEFLIHQYHNHLIPPYYEDLQWTATATPGVFESLATWLFPNKIDIDNRAAGYYAYCTSVKNFGAATFYLSVAKEESSDWLYGEKNYKLNVPANAPVRDFWSVEVYDLETAGWLKGVNRTGRDANVKELKKNKDGSIDIYFGTEAPKGKEGNWIPTVEGKRFFLLFRFYGPNKEVFTKEWKLNDLIKLD